MRLISSMAAVLLTTGGAVFSASDATAEVAIPRSANARACANRVNNTTAKITSCVTLQGVRAHQAALQDIADANGGTRASGSPGYDASVDYVVERLEAAGYEPTVQTFNFVTYIELTPSAFEQISPTPTSYVEDFSTGDFYTMSYSGSGDVTGIVEPIADISLGAGNTSTSGCEASDFVGFTPGNIALIQRGACDFSLKADNAIAAGASAVIIFNQGNTPDREGVIAGTLGEAFTGDVPVVGVPYALGVEFINTAPVTVRLFTDTERMPTTTYNVLAELEGRSDEHVVMVGGHLNSVQEGPGINDNGSGSAAILEVAEQIAKVKPYNAVRFAWWGGEESGLVGSTYYVQDLIDRYFAEGDETILQIGLYLNFDMVGSPNYVFKIYDGDGSDFGISGPPGSDVIEAYFERFYTRVGQPYKATEFSGRSDYGPFIDLADIPSGGLFTGAEEIKTPEEEAIWGGTAGAQLDPCYHLACDTFDNNNDDALDVNSDAIAAATLYFAKRRQPLVPPAPAMTGARVAANTQLQQGSYDFDRLGSLYQR